MLVLFDLDGTLLDSRQAHIDAAAAAFERQGIPADPARLERFLMGHDARSSGLEEEEFLRVWSTIQPLYRAAQDSIRPFPGAIEALRELSSAGSRLGVVTSKRRWAVERELVALGLDDKFDAVVCREDTDRHKPNPQPLLHAQTLIGARAAAYVGDAQTDMVAARAAGVVPLGVGWGWDEPQKLQSAGAAMVLQDFGELAAALQRFASRDASGA